MRGISPVNQEERYTDGGSGPSRVCFGICRSVCGHNNTCCTCGYMNSSETLNNMDQ